MCELSEYEIYVDIRVVIQHQAIYCKTVKADAQLESRQRSNVKFYQNYLLKYIIA